MNELKCATTVPTREKLGITGELGELARQIVRLNNSVRNINNILCLGKDAWEEENSKPCDPCEQLPTISIADTIQMLQEMTDNSTRTAEEVIGRL